MNIYNKLPYDVRNKFFRYFKHPVAQHLQIIWKAPQVRKKFHMIAQFNRYNWFMYNSRSHNYGDPVIRNHIKNIETLSSDIQLLAKIVLFHSIDYGYNGHVPILYAYGHNKRKTIQKRIFGICHDGKWFRRSLYGGIYPMNRRFRKYAPRNPFTRKWSLRWRKRGELWELSSVRWWRKPWRGFGWLIPGDIIRIPWAQPPWQNIIVGIKRNWIPALSTGLDPYI